MYIFMHIYIYIYDIYKKIYDIEQHELMKSGIAITNMYRYDIYLVVLMVLYSININKLYK